MEYELNAWQRKVKAFLADLHGAPGTNLFCTTYLPEEVRAFADLTGLHPLLVATVICGEAMFYLWPGSRMVDGIHWPGMMSLTNKPSGAAHKAHFALTKMIDVNY